ncbi:MAG: hypothetical protein EAX96_03375 [Candidatus Lokiarchaeota archaeon]|nr:hypothetical protein [Candidatus Lokiarchaeota archaeon]
MVFKFQATAFAPGHITMIFSIRDQSPDLLKKGSIGVGFSIEKGVKTTITLGPSKSKKIAIKFNGTISDAPVTRAVFDQFSNFFKENNSITINHAIDFPISAGFGASGAGALSTAFALNELLGNVYDSLFCGQIAHKAEVMNKTGLGDVIAQYHGGFEMRIKEGAPGFGMIKSLDLGRKNTIILGTWGILETKKVLSNEYERKMIINHGEKILNNLFKSETQNLDNICKKAQNFSNQTNLESKEIKSTLNLLNHNSFNNSGMIMLGNSFYSFIKNEQVDEFTSLLSKSGAIPKQYVTKISKLGVKVL